MQAVSGYNSCDIADCHLGCSFEDERAPLVMFVNGAAITLMPYVLKSSLIILYLQKLISRIGLSY